MWRCDNVGGLGEHAACHLYGFYTVIQRRYFDYAGMDF